MRRREFITLIGTAAAAWPLVAYAQQPDRVRRVGVLLPFDENDPEAKNRIRQFRLGMRDLNWIEGRNVLLIDFWFSADNLESTKRSVAELIKAAPEVIVAYGTPGLAAVRPATSTIPIVFDFVSDPVGQGFVPSLAHPGGNITGFSSYEPEIVGKWINLLSELKPGLSRATLMFNPNTAPAMTSSYRSLKTTPRPSVEVEVAHVRTADEIESTIAKLGNEQGSGLILGADNFLVTRREPIIKLANERRVPTIAPYRQFAVDGGLVTYGPDTVDISRRASAYVDRILRGERPGNLPVQSPIKFELVVNLKTAKALGLSVRESFLELCDEVIE